MDAQPSTRDSARGAPVGALEVESWLAPRRFALVLAILIMLRFAAVLFGGQTFFFRDYGLFGYPLAAYHRECFWRGEIPFWNPYNSCGVPFMAQWNTMVFYPGSLIYLLLPLPWSLSFFCLSHLWLAGFGMFMLARLYSGSSIAATVAGLAFVFGGLLSSSLKYPNNIAALGLMPWVIYFAEQCFVEKASVRRLATVGAVQMLAGAPEIIALTWIYIAARSLGACAEKRLAVRKLIISVMLVSALAAVQLIPFLHLLAHSQRREGLLSAEWPMPIWGLANFFVPLFRCFRSYHGVYAQPDQYWISSYYLPISLAMFVPFAFTGARRRIAVLLAVVAGASILLAMGNAAFFYRLFAVLPGSGLMRFPIKFVVLAVFTLALLGGLGLARFCNGLRMEMRRPLIYASVIVCGIIIVLIAISQITTFTLENSRVTLLSALSRIALIAGVLLAALRFSSTNSKAALLAIVSLIGIDAVFHAPNENPTISSAIYRLSARDAEVFPQLGQGRAMVHPAAEERLNHAQFATAVEDFGTSRLAMYSNCNLLDDVPKVDGFFSLLDRNEGKLEALLYSQTNRVSSALLDVLAVTQLSEPTRPTHWTTRSNALPVVFSPARVQLLEPNLILNKMIDEGFDSQTAFLALSSGKLQMPPKITPATISLKRFAADRIEFSTEASDGSVVVISQTAAPGWTAWLDGRPTELLTANYAFQGVIVPAGNHDIVLKYKPPGFALGAAISGLAWSGLLVKAVLGRRRQ